MGKKLGKKLDRLLTLVIAVILLPLFLTIILQRMKLEDVIYGEQDLWADTEEPIPHKTEQTTDTEQKIIGILAKEIRADAGDEAILAQSVIVRTSLYDAWEKQTDEPVGLTEEEMRALWGEDYPEIRQRLEVCTALTKDEVLMWEGDFAYTPYHAMSAGMTRDISTLYEEADMPYLTQISCVEDATAEGSLCVTSMKLEDFIEKCREEFDKAEIKDVSDIAVLSRDEAGYVIELKIGNIEVSGEEFRNRIGLHSACFTLTELDGQIRIVTRGFGHGLGLSQYTAECMAKKGAGYREILAYFYPGTEVKKVGE